MIRSATRRWLVTAAFLYTIAALLHGACVHGAMADERDADNFDGFLEPIRLAHDVPALAALLIHGERIVGIGAVGYRKSGETIPVGRDDRWHLGSIGKSMTATMIARLVERGVLSWELSLGEALGEAVPGMDSAYRAVTLEDLLAHRSGLVGAMTALKIWNGKLWRSTEPKADLRMAIAREALALPPEAPPGEVFHYSNAGYVIAGALAERAAGEPWDELMLHELFEPLGMNSSGFGAPGTAGELSQPWGHYEGRSRVVPVEPGLGGDSPPALGPAGTIHASLGDVGRYLSAHLLGSRGRGWLLSPDTFGQLHRSRQGQDYSLGWVVVASPLAGGLALTHAGSNLNWYSVAWVMPALNIALFVVANQGGQAGFRAVDEAVGVVLQYAGETIPGVAR
ncbi:MAG: serine hydrolase domain-containing protein [Alphaproteobacteria bacterium]|jgi:CubicO group peptidase (beta-lactamase class C family)|nr:serine hydrolase domain-containing protein [Alphaproteobacteria bacterium]|tara:strand:- start:196 stop:1383 length:1188 start_codon:yes stop_codon:yes gene_type:complete